ncbi:MAG: GNAT family protein [Chitinophagales bacterium]|nr:GNAT family N-acetyltransferase [Bacteroidota bacterium]
MISLPRNTITTARLNLQPYQVLYALDFFTLIRKNENRLVEYFPKTLEATQTLNDTKDCIQEKIFDWNKKKSFAFMIFLKEDNSLIGHINIKDIDWKKRSAELSYFIDETHENQGLMSEAIQCLLQLCFKILKLENVTAQIVNDNTTSIKVAQKNGLQYEGAFYHTTQNNNHISRYGISKEVYLG